ncbi:DNA-dependent metalloprotease SPRTN [Microplitis mediator]|uniref:DNA-dependent metalloprotease SPRTN n=1 Tax=Microplitis mediator TaxID=375433 RepID=UPI002556DD49|nr:DNA-dependent metalloprotease SPRTN [Microplitis mediator]
MSNKYFQDLNLLNNQVFHGITENAVFPDHLNEIEYRPRTLIDETLEIIDPTPNVYTMFVQFNEKFFWNELVAVQVRWSTRMTTCAGTCSFHPRNRECVISLSAPLLKLRPRKDLVETLLHEMIHGYLFVTNNNRDRDGHGPEFCKHMERINREAGTKITIYHDFHDEVRLYQQHWWRCNGPCQHRKPFFGTVRRAMNRAPGPSDFWWKNHQQTCGGEFIKIREPDVQKPKNKKSNEVSKPLPKQNTLDNFIQTNLPKNKISGDGEIVLLGSKTKTVNSKTVSGDSNSTSEGIKKLGNKTNNVFGFGTGGPGSKSSNPTPSNTKPFTSPKPPANRVNFSGTLGGSNSGTSNLLTRFMSPGPKSKPASTDKSNEAAGKNAPQCPICNKSIPDDNINHHIDLCLAANDTDSNPPRKRLKVESKDHECPFCHEKFEADLIDLHVDVCLNLDSTADNTATPQALNSSSDNSHSRDSPARPETNRINCPKCNRLFRSESINDHLDVCLNEAGDLAQPPDNSYVNLTNDDITDLTASPVKSKTETIECVACGRYINIKQYSDHSDECLKKAKNKLEKDLGPVIVIDDSDSKPGCSKTSGSSKSHTRNTYKCLVCDSMISREIPLNEHLETCALITFGDTTLDSPTEVEAPASMEQRYLCPICNLMIIGKDMAEHVDWCITRND